MIDKPIYVTSPLLPPLEDFTFLLKEIWESKMLTNNGNFHQKLNILKFPISVYLRTVLYL